jgi:hypothetical protein
LAVAHAFEEIAPWSYEKAYGRLSTR